MIFLPRREMEVFLQSASDWTPRENITARARLFRRISRIAWFFREFFENTQQSELSTRHVRSLTTTSAHIFMCTCGVIQSCHICSQANLSRALHCSDANETRFNYSRIYFAMRNVSGYVRLFSDASSSFPFVDSARLFTCESDATRRASISFTSSCSAGLIPLVRENCIIYYPHRRFPESIILGHSCCVRFFKPNEWSGKTQSDFVYCIRNSLSLGIECQDLGIASRRGSAWKWTRASET